MSNRNEKVKKRLLRKRKRESRDRPDLKEVARNILKNSGGEYLSHNDKKHLYLLSNEMNEPMGRYEKASYCELIQMMQPFSCVKNTNLWASAEEGRTIHYGYCFDHFMDFIHIIPHCFGRELDGTPVECTPCHLTPECNHSVVFEDSRIEKYLSGKTLMSPSYVWLTKDNFKQVIHKVSTFIGSEQVPFSDEYSFEVNSFYGDPILTLEKGILTNREFSEIQKSEFVKFKSRYGFDIHDLYRNQKYFNFLP